MSKYYTSGVGHYGDQNGDAGQAKPVWNACGDEDTAAEKLQEELCGNKIEVKVLECYTDPATGETETSILGTDQQLAAVEAYCKAHHPFMRVSRITEVSEGFAAPPLPAGNEKAGNLPGKSHDPPGIFRDEVGCSYRYERGHRVYVEINKYPGT